MSTAQVEHLLAQLKSNAAIVMGLYPLLTKINYHVLVAPGTGWLVETASFLTYPISDRMHALPAFTSDTYPLFDKLKRDAGAEGLAIKGLPFLQHLKDKNVIAEHTEIAINPGWEHGILISRPILLGILSLVT
jgi:hypothetical protein